MVSQTNLRIWIGRIFGRNRRLLFNALDEIHYLAIGGDKLIAKKVSIE